MRFPLISSHHLADSIRHGILGVFLVLACLGCNPDGAEQKTTDSTGSPRVEIGASRDSTLVQTSESGAYQVEIRAEDPEASRATMHSWIVRISTHEGTPIHPTRLAFSGGMPQHGHGFPTAPHVTAVLDEAWYRVGGILFHMGGEWTIRVEFVGPEGPDVALFDLFIPH